MKKIILTLCFLLSFVFSATLSEIQTSGVLKVGVRDGKPPFTNISDGKYEGFEIELANAIAKAIFNEKRSGGGDVKFVTLQTSNRIEALEKGDVDIVITTLTITDERAKRIDFSMPYFSVNLGVLTRKNDNIQRLSDFNTGKKLLVEDGSVGQKYFTQKGFNTVLCRSSNECYKMLKNNEGDGFATDNLIVLSYPILDRSVEVNIKNVGDTDFLGIGVQKGNKELLDIINQTLIDLSKHQFFKDAFDNEINPFYKGTAEKKYFLLDDIYRIFG
ncbi:amino acid ABC transporter, periplasmic cysteine-binding protein [Campylobacter blaseri]|uniref:Amino acid ABC transporter substrate-binding protein n=1 Tax=Campylobacter blaseri TaxID=2042961 RepID=A0A2P8R3M7_9BACT|nr:transporter substrate-binding domain-containing protein [Campylobacter blaseri]PSM53094.1 amino acid ABC transporter substrate-binding protein [Campylobacter blaseri]QKF86968.1 amino acid ABC transporter, periplasmic cysteine-binding protein [Campylobacter blaseri]